MSVSRSGTRSDTVSASRKFPQVRACFTVSHSSDTVGHATVSRTVSRGVRKSMIRDTVKFDAESRKDDHMTTIRTSAGWPTIGPLAVTTRVPTRRRQRWHVRCQDGVSERGVRPAQFACGLVLTLLTLAGCGSSGDDVASCTTALRVIGRTHLAAVQKGRQPAPFRSQVSIPECDSLSPQAYEVARSAALHSLGLS